MFLENEIEKNSTFRPTGFEEALKHTQIAYIVKLTKIEP